jgi:hypothetical protein
MYLFWRRVLKRGGGTTAFPISADGRNLRTKSSLYTETKKNFVKRMRSGIAFSGHGRYFECF